MVYVRFARNSQKDFKIAAFCVFFLLSSKELFLKNALWIVYQIDQELSANMRPEAFFLAFSLAMLSTSRAFVFVPAYAGTLGRGQSLKSASSEELDQTNKKVITNPSMAFGKPVSEDMQEFNKASVGFIKQTLFDNFFAGENRDYARFYALETIARVPYFSYLAALHFYETIGRWRKANYLKIHFAESWNEMHHLLIMEELGGADRWFDRFLAQHVAVGYYWFVLFLYLYNPTHAYNLNQAIEEHAFATYDQFCKEHEKELKAQPPSEVAKKYYRDGDLYMFDEIQTETCNPRRPVINNLYDTFMAVRDDEWEHVKTMQHLQTDMEVTNVHDPEDGLCDVSDVDDIQFA